MVGPAGRPTPHAKWERQEVRAPGAGGQRRPLQPEAPTNTCFGDSHDSPLVLSTVASESWGKEIRNV